MTHFVAHLNRRTVLRTTIGALGTLGLAIDAVIAATSGLAVTTSAPLSVNHCSAALWGSLDDLGGASSVEVSEEYREHGTNSWQRTRTETPSTTASVRHYVDGLAAGLTDECRLTAIGSDGDTDTGSTVTVTTDDTMSLRGRTEAETDVTDSSATLQGVLDDLGGADSANVSFEWRIATTDDPTETGTQTLTSTGSFSEGISGLASDTFYEYRALATASDGDVDASGWWTFKTEQ